jgi:hypothetical protein
MLPVTNQAAQATAPQARKANILRGWKNEHKQQLGESERTALPDPVPQPPKEHCVSVRRTASYPMLHSRVEGRDQHPGDRVPRSGTQQVPFHGKIHRGQACLSWNLYIQVGDGQNHQRFHATVFASVSFLTTAPLTPDQTGTTEFLSTRHRPTCLPVYHL